MKFLCYSTAHDSNWTYYDTDTRELYYGTAEREYNAKNATATSNTIVNIAQTRFKFDRNNPEHIMIVWNKATPELGEWNSTCPQDKLYNKITDNLYTVDHHYAHILSSLALDSTIEQGIAIDGVGDWNRKCLVVKNLQDINNLEFFVPEGNPRIGKLFSLFCKALNIKERGTLFDKERASTRNVGKIMGLQSYGKINKEFYDLLNSYPLDDDHYKIFNKLFRSRLSKIDIYDENSNVDDITTCYQFLGDKIVELFDKYMDKSKKIAYAGGCALSTVANEDLIDAGYNITVCPAANDSGISIGLMKFADMYFNLNIDFSNLVYITYDDTEPTIMPEENIKFAAELLAKNEIISIAYGPSEVGPRALGHRSILMNPSIKNGKDFINDKVKHREWWRPFGGSSISTEVISNYKESDLDYYMLRNFQINPEWKEKLNSIVHVDNSCRLQITKNEEEPLYKIIKEFEKLTGIPTVLNTSYNIAGRPIPSYKNHILDTFKMLDNINYLFYNDKIFTKINGIITEYKLLK